MSVVQTADVTGAESETKLEYIYCIISLIDGYRTVKSEKYQFRVVKRVVISRVYTPQIHGL